jgi:hypothetical protein
MKAVKITNTHHENAIDNDWAKFLMGSNGNGGDLCDEYTPRSSSSSSPLPLDKNKHKIKNHNNGNSNNNNKKNSKNDFDKQKLKQINKTNDSNSDDYNGGDYGDNDDDDQDCIYLDNLNAHRKLNNLAANNENRNTTDMDAEAQFVEVPTCSPIYISTKTKISFLNTPIDIKKVFWDVPIMPYASQCPGIIKKQIKFSCTTKEELEEIEEYTQKEIDKNDGFIETQIIEHIDNPDGRIKFKDHRKINIGLSKKDILNCRSKKKRAFFNCFVLIIRVEDENSPPDARIFKEMHIKVFNTGKLEIPGIQHDDSLQNVIDILIRTLKIVVGEHIDCKKNNCETVLINSNFNCGFYIDRDKLYNILKYKYRINSNYDSCSYPGIQCKFFYYTGRKHISDDDGNGNDDNGNGNDKTIQSNKDKDKHHIQNGQQPAANLSDYIEISFMIFRTGSVLIVGKCEDYVLHDIYDFIKELFRVEFLNIYSHIIQPEDDVVKKHVPKLRTRIIVNDM